MGLSAGIDIGGTKIAAGVVDDHGRILAQQRLATGGRDAERVERAVSDLVLALKSEYEIEAVMQFAAFIERPEYAVRPGQNQDQVESKQEDREPEKGLR